MSFKVEIIKDSIGPTEIRATTFLIEYPRIIHSEVMTHRVFSRNASSSRAIPAKTAIKRIRDDMFVPLKFQAPHNGMQGYEYLEGLKLATANAQWNKLGVEILDKCEYLLDRFNDGKGLFTKQLLNRITEPFSHIKVVVTSTEWKNWFALRNHPAAEIHIQHLAKLMSDAYNNSIPEQLQHSQWHLPFITKDDSGSINDLIKISTARCARTSYYNNFGKCDIQADLKLHDDLVAGDPKHASPTEHQLQALPIEFKEILVLPYIGVIPKGCEIKVKDINNKRTYEIWSGNIKGWIQYRKTIPNENIDDIS